MILLSRRLAPKKHLGKLSSSLNLDPLAADNLSQAHTRDWLATKGVALPKAAEPDLDESENPEIREISDGDSILLKSWLNLAILEFSLCKGFREDLKFLAEKFSVTSLEVKQSLVDLESSGFLLRQEGVLKKQTKKMRIPTKRSREIIRHFHMQMLKRAIHHLEVSKTPTDFERRLVFGYTTSVNPKHLEKAMLKMERSVIDTCALLGQGECTEVYQVQLQMFPLTKDRPRSD